jgi:hypothetical protein
MQKPSSVMREGAMKWTVRLLADRTPRLFHFIVSPQRSEFSFVVSDNECIIS